MKSQIGFIYMSTTEVIERCERLIEHILRTRRHENREFIQAYLARRKRLSAIWPFYKVQLCTSKLKKKLSKRNGKFPSTYGVEFEVETLDLLKAAKVTVRKDMMVAANAHIIWQFDSTDISPEGI